LLIFHRSHGFEMTGGKIMFALPFSCTSNWCKLVGDFALRLGDVLLLGLFSPRF